MNEKHIYILLKIVQSNGDILRLKREGVDFSEIAELTKFAIDNNFLEYKERSIYLTEIGLSQITKLEKHFKQTDKSKWIEPEKKSRIPKLDESEIFLPNQNEIHF